MNLPRAVFTPKQALQSHFSMFSCPWDVAHPLPSPGLEEQGPLQQHSLPREEKSPCEQHLQGSDGKRGTPIAMSNAQSTTCTSAINDRFAKVFRQNGERWH